MKDYVRKPVLSSKPRGLCSSGRSGRAASTCPPSGRGTPSVSGSTPRSPRPSEAASEEPPWHRRQIYPPRSEFKIVQAAFLSSIGSQGANLEAPKLRKIDQAVRVALLGPMLKYL